MRQASADPMVAEDSRPSKSGSLARKLLLQVVLLMVAVVTVFVAASYAEVRRLSLESNSERLLRIVQEFSRTSEATQEGWRSTAAAIGADPMIIRFLGDPNGGPEGVREVVGPVAAADPRMEVELWDPSGAPLFATAADAVSETHRSAASRSLALEAPDGDAWTGPLYGADPGSHFWTIAPVREGPELLGYVALRREIRRGPDVEEQLRAIVGHPAGIYIANREDGVWTDLRGAPVAPRARFAPAAGGDLLVDHLEPDDFVSASAAVPGTPWILVGEIPVSAIEVRWLTFLRRSIPVGAMLIGLGALGMGLLARRITGSLRELAGVAEAVGAGEYHHRAEIPRRDEIGTLAGAFNEMAARIEVAQYEREAQFLEASRLAEKLQRSNRDLESSRRLAEHARQRAELATLAAEQAREEAEASNHAKSQFLAMMSHEIRTPIHAISGYAALLHAGIGGPVTEEQRKQIDRIRRSGEHLLVLVNELLDLPKIESGQLALERIPAKISTALEAALGMSRLDADARGVTIHEVREGRGRAGYLGDPQRVRQIVSNLLSNAIKFASEGGQVTLRYGVAQPLVAGSASSAPDADGMSPPRALRGPPGRLTYLTVEDDGIGIASEELERIFLPFVQLDTGHARSRSGTGLGLTISRRLARLMDGDLTVTSRLGEGSRFTLWLPHHTSRHTSDEGGLVEDVASEAISGSTG